MDSKYFEKIEKLKWVESKIKDINDLASKISEEEGIKITFKLPKKKVDKAEIDKDYSESPWVFSMYTPNQKKESVYGKTSFKVSQVYAFEILTIASRDLIDQRARLIKQINKLKLS